MDILGAIEQTLGEIFFDDPPPTPPPPKMAKKLINDPSRVVPDAIDGLLMTDSRLRRVGDLNIIVRHDIEVFRRSAVTIISGGGSGHEPAHAGYIGEGMLSAAVLGNVFASPSVSAILAAIRVCAGPHGVLLVVKNYTGDRLNFGMAMEKAKQEKIKVKMVIVEDDCALPKGKGITGGRGVAGTVFVHKVAGAAAASGRSLDEVYAEATRASKLIGTLGIALTTCTVPGAPPSQRLADPQLYEIGMGIHGEPGRGQRELPERGAANVVSDLMCEVILGSVPEWGGPVTLEPRLVTAKGDRVVVMLNNLGGLPYIELLIIARRVMTNLRKRGLRPVRAYIGPFMTALEMSGVSVSVFKIDDALLDSLDAPTTAPAWVAAKAISETSGSSSESIPYSGEDYKATVSGGFACPVAIDVAKRISNKINEIEPLLTEYDAVCGDGDCGLVMQAGARRVLADLAAAEDNAVLGIALASDCALLCHHIADSISASMGGTSGAILEIFFRSMATTLSTKGGCTDTGSQRAAWVEALGAGLDAVKFYGGATVGMRTMLDALEPGIEALKKGESVAVAAAAATAGMELTKTMGSLAGRSNYVSQDKMEGVPDPGAAAVASAFEVAKLRLSA